MLCDTTGGDLVWQDARCRVIVADEPDYPGFVRVVWQAHVAESSDLTVADRQHLLAVVDQVERVTRAVMTPDKINLAALGNVVPHLHWHVIPRFCDDAHFPAPHLGGVGSNGGPRGTTNATQRRLALACAFARFFTV